MDRFRLFPDKVNSSECVCNKAPAHRPNKGPFSDTSSAGSGSGSRSMLSEYVSDWPPLSVGSSSPAGEAAHNWPAADACMVSPLLKLLDSCIIESTCCCFCKAAWDKRKTTQRQDAEYQIRDINQKCSVPSLLLEENYLSVWYSNCSYCSLCSSTTKYDTVVMIQLRHLDEKKPSRLFKKTSLYVYNTLPIHQTTTLTLLHPTPLSVNTSYLLLGQLDLVELLHVLLIVLLLELTDEAYLLLWAVGVLLGRILLELHRRLGIQCCHYLLSRT